MRHISFDALVWREGDVFVSQCLNVEVSSYGDTVEDALDSLKEAVELHLSGASEEEVFKMIEARSEFSPPPASIERLIPLELRS